MEPKFSRSITAGALRPRMRAWLLASCAVFVISPAVAQSLDNPPIADTATGTTGATGNTAAITDPQTTGAVAASDLPPALDEEFNRLNRREETIDGLRTRIDPYEGQAPGIRIGTFVLKPALSETFNHERQKTGDRSESRSFIETGLKGSLTSDWSRHQLSVTGEGVLQNNTSGEGEEEPRADVDAELRLDLSDQTIARLRAGYSFEREDANDPNAIANAESQSGVNIYRLGAAVERDYGLIRGSLGVDFERRTYGDVELDNGTRLSVEDRNRNIGVLDARIGYELSPALIPFLEASVGKSNYDLREDMFGFERSYQNYAGRAGLEVDLGEKLNGELALGYETYRFDDDRLGDLRGLSVDGRVNWSPQRGTDVLLGLETYLDPSTTPGDAGSINYALTSIVTRQLRSTLVARLSNSLTLRNFPSDATSSDEATWRTGAGLTWDMSRYLALTGDVSYERTNRDRGQSTDTARIGLGLTLRR
ncbi:MULTISPECIES: outer membrane beta-barrel protein [unclassified Sinorhizobium]|uniref:outer membrane beta-barrel protein n=1 Tax=unclassified Sinorhizobium TaxID=2613772 RepID=UPI0024C31125|nr:MULTISPECIES: outer membrane beta-barrel protein [unclassified Sinorhizobium]MDK1375290.1 outer membrane beta-barrel protein [Sinorhizobium sp. 6-70]MDK1479401.1 outer membrane beta-barrel protein [Sinorhizobium sp. 6-117]